MSQIKAVPSALGIDELRDGWRLTPASETDGDGRSLSSGEQTSGIAIKQMPATVLKAQVDAGVYEEDLYLGDALAGIDQELWKEDWWYTTSLEIPAGHEQYSLQFDGISYRAEIWLNGSLIAGPHEAMGSWRRLEFDVSRAVMPGQTNHLAVLITPERRTPGLVVTDLPVDGSPEGVDLTDTWADWINFRFHGDAEEKKTYLPDKNSGIIRRVRLTYGGPVSIRHPFVRTELPLPETDSADLTVYADLRNHTDRPVGGVVRGSIEKEGKPPVKFETRVELDPREVRDFSLDSSQDGCLHIENPDLWWPYTWGDPALYRLELTFVADGEQEPSGAADLDFGIRQITGHRDETKAQPQFDEPGSFYLKVNGLDYLVRGGAYSPDLFFESNDQQRVQRVMDHAKDLGVNLIRWEGHLIDDGLIELCDREGMPAMVGTMCCGAWERWHEWDEENYEVARLSIAETVKDLRAHPSIFLWSNGSDGLPPEDVLGGYHRGLAAAHWQNPILDTVSTRNRDWSGVHMNGPYTWRAPVFWYLPENANGQGSCAEEGNNEVVPLLSSMREMLPGDSLWPFNDTWATHAGSVTAQLAGTRKMIDRRFGGAGDIEEFVFKAQIAQYEAARGQMEAYAARGWETNKFTVYWMMNAPWPSFFGHVFDWRWGKGGVYYGMKKALQPISAAFDYFALGDRETAEISLFNQTLERASGLAVTVRVYQADGTRVSEEKVTDLVAEPSSVTVPIKLGRPEAIGPVYFVRVTLSDAGGNTLVDNTYWQAEEHDVPNLRVVDGIFDAMRVRQTTWPDFSPLLELPESSLVTRLSEIPSREEGTRHFEVNLANPGDRIAFFVRAELRLPGTETEILPSRYSDNFVTVYPGETLSIQADIESALIDGAMPELHVEGANIG